MSGIWRKNLWKQSKDRNYTSDTLPYMETVACLEKDLVHEKEQQYRNIEKRMTEKVMVG